jgi:hypothetical protein
LFEDVRGSSGCRSLRRSADVVQLLLRGRQRLSLLLLLVLLLLLPLLLLPVPLLLLLLFSIVIPALAGIRP